MTTANYVAITGNTYPVKDALKALGCRWDADRKCWMAPPERAEDAAAIVAGTGPKAAYTPQASKPFRHTKCKVCGFVPTNRYEKIYRSGECRDCYEERKMGY